jgi:hypothetical protein
VTIFVGWRTNGFCIEGRDGLRRASDDEEIINVAINARTSTFTTFFMR